ncbi:MAG: hypothetical protein R3F21_13100 [Myxococcota bacterium]
MREIAAVDVEIDPDRREITDRQDGPVGRNVLARRGIPLEHDTREARADLVGVQTLVALDDGEQIADRDRIAEALVDGADDAGEARRHVGEGFFVRDDASRERPHDAHRRGTGRRRLDARRALLLRRQHDAVPMRGLLGHGRALGFLRCASRVAGARILHPSASPAIPAAIAMHRTIPVEARSDSLISGPQQGAGQALDLPARCDGLRRRRGALLPGVDPGALGFEHLDLREAATSS